MAYKKENKGKPKEREMDETPMDKGQEGKVETNGACLTAEAISKMRENFRKFMDEGCEAPSSWTVENLKTGGIDA
jgi:hypothetical protein